MLFCIIHSTFVIFLIKWLILSFYLPEQENLVFIFPGFSPAQFLEGIFAAIQ